MASLSTSSVRVIYPAPLQRLGPITRTSPAPLIPTSRVAPGITIVWPARLETHPSSRLWTGTPPFGRQGATRVIYPVPATTLGPSVVRVWTTQTGSGGAYTTPGMKVIYPIPEGQAQIGTVPPTDGWSGITL